MRWFTCGLWLCCLPAFSACNQSTPSTSTPVTNATGGVAVIDLDEVARRLGKETAIKQALAERELNLNQQLETMRVSYLGQVNQRKRELTEQPESGDPKEIQTLEQQALVNIRKAQQLAQNDLATRKRDLINGFREEIKPVASQVAAARGLSVVISKNESVLFSFDSAVDITTDVVQQMRTTAGVSTTDSSSAGQNSAVPVGAAQEPQHLPQMPQRSIQTGE